MRRLLVDTTIEAPIAEIWEDLAVIERHVEWMNDAVAIRFTSERRQGIGTAFVCDTKVGPLRLTDHMSITGWDEQHRIAVKHTGLVTGSGEFRLKALSEASCQFEWDEQLSFPWWMGGRLTEVIGCVVLRQIWKRNLALFAARFDA